MDDNTMMMVNSLHTIPFLQRIRVLVSICSFIHVMIFCSLPSAVSCTYASTFLIWIRILPTFALEFPLTNMAFVSRHIRDIVLIWVFLSYMSWQLPLVRGWRPAVPRLDIAGRRRAGGPSPHTPGLGTSSGHSGTRWTPATYGPGTLGGYGVATRQSQG